VYFYLKLDYPSTNLKKPFEAPIEHGIKKLKELKIKSKENKSFDRPKINRSAYSSSKIKINNPKQHEEEYHSKNKSLNYIRENHNKLPDFSHEDRDVFNTIIALWQELGVTDNYKKTFEEISEQLDLINRNGYYEFELNQLKNLKENLTRLSEEIKSREKAIELFSYFEIYIKKKENENNVLENIIATIQNIRVLSINIVNHFIKFRKTSSYDILNGKFDINLIESNFKIDFNYLIKMKNDSDFLANSALKSYFNFSNESDPFFITVASSYTPTFSYHENDINSFSNFKKIKVPIEDNMLVSIKTCQFYIIQELAYTEMNRVANDSSKFLSSASLYHRNLRSANHSNKNFSQPVININNSKKNLNSQNLINRNFFLNTNKPRKLVKMESGSNNSIQKYLNNPSRLFSAKSKEKLNDSRVNVVVTDEKIGDDTSMVIKKPKKIKIHTEHAEKEEPRNDTNLPPYQIRKEKSDGNEMKKIRLDSRNRHKQDIYDEENKQNNNSPRNNQMNDQEKMFEIIKKIDDALKVSETIERIENMEKLSEEKTKEKSGYINNPYEIDGKIQDIKFNNKNSNRQIPLVTHDVIDSEVLSPNKEKLNNICDSSIINKSEHDNNFDIRNVSFKIHSGNINLFQSNYAEYLSRINEEQKVIFNIDPEIKYYARGNFPKILKINYNLNSNDYLCGVAAIYYDPYNPNIKLIISQFSTIFFNFYHEIFQKFLNYIKECIRFKEIYLELHYGNNNKINIKYITEIISKKNKFRWIALENTEEGRKTKYRYVDSDNNMSDDPYMRNDPRDIFNLVNCIVINMKEKQKINKKFTSENFSNDEYEICLFPVTCLLSNLVYNHDFESENGLMKNFKHGSLTKYQNVVKNVGSTKSEVEEFLKDNLKVEESQNSDYLIPQLVNNYFNETGENIYSVLMKVNLKFENVFTMRIENIIYNRITVSIL